MCTLLRPMPKAHVVFPGQIYWVWKMVLVLKSGQWSDFGLIRGHLRLGWSNQRRT